MVGISSVKLPDASEGSINNNYLYNDKELFDDGGLNWYNYGFRNYDPQIGRFMQLDPLTDAYPELTPYQYANCDPIANIDFNGLAFAPALVDVGVDLLPWANGFLYDGWDQWRARLEKINVNSTRDNFYFHDSYKGYSHGCIETSSDLYFDLLNFKNNGLKSIRVKVKYPGANSLTNGETKQNPPPKTKRMIKGGDGRMHPSPD